MKPSPAVAFEKQYGITLAQLSELFGRPIWKDSYRGGNKWAEIAGKVQAAVEAHAVGDINRRDQLIEEVLAMDHNTGKVCDKLQKLNAICEEP